MGYKITADWYHADWYRQKVMTQFTNFRNQI